MNKVNIYSDGAYSRLRDVGAYAYMAQYLVFDANLKTWLIKKEARFSQKIDVTTNNRMELMGVIEGLKLLKIPCEVEVFSDATYVTNTINKWIDKFVKDPKRLNLDLMIELKKAIGFHKKVTATWVRGHDEHIENEIVNEMAQRAAGTWRGK